jgi:hypothetical protein
MAVIDSLKLNRLVLVGISIGGEELRKLRLTSVPILAIYELPPNLEQALADNTYVKVALATPQHVLSSLRYSG